jgi:hypothetical protein
MQRARQLAIATFCAREQHQGLDQCLGSAMVQASLGLPRVDILRKSMVAVWKSSCAMEPTLPHDPKYSRINRNAGPVQTFLSMDAKRRDFRAQTPLATGESDISVAASIFEILHSRRGLGVTDPLDMLFAHLCIAVGRVRKPKMLANLEVYEYLAMFLL